MNRIAFYATICLFLILTSCKCDYATYRFDQENEEFQIILYSGWNNGTIKIIGRNYSTLKFWNFEDGDYVIFNNKYKLLNTNTSLNDTSNFNQLNFPKEFRKYLENTQHDFVSAELTQEEQDFLLNSWITEIDIKTEGKIWHAELKPDKSEDFRQIFNCRYAKDLKFKKRILNSK